MALQVRREQFEEARVGELDLASPLLSRPEPLGRSTPDAGQTREFTDEPVNGGGIRGWATIRGSDGGLAARHR